MASCWCPLWEYISLITYARCPCVSSFCAMDGHHSLWRNKKNTSLGVIYKKEFKKYSSALALSMSAGTTLLKRC